MGFAILMLLGITYQIFVDFPQVDRICKEKGYLHEFGYICYKAIDGGSFKEIWYEKIDTDWIGVEQ